MTAMFDAVERSDLALCRLPRPGIVGVVVLEPAGHQTTRRRPTGVLEASAQT
jgi:hypothetical protein